MLFMNDFPSTGMELTGGPVSILTATLGFIMSVVCLRLGSFWFALLVHITMALSKEWFSIRHHPDMELIRKAAAE
jgi:hypothetical protein